MNVQRYDMRVDISNYGLRVELEPEESDTGDWVKHADVARLIDEARTYDESVGDVVAATVDGDITLDDGIQVTNPRRAAEFFKARVTALEAEAARMREALEEVLACIKLDPTMDGSIRPRGFTVEIIEAIRTARTALAPAAQKDVK